MSNLQYFAQLIGCNTSTLVIFAGQVLGVTTLKAYFDYKENVKKEHFEKMKNEITEYDIQKKYEELKAKDHLNKDQAEMTEVEKKVYIEQEAERIKLEQKEETVTINNMLNDIAEPRSYIGQKSPNNHSLLWGYDLQYQNIWGDAVNYIVTGTTGNGKTRKLMVMLLNYLANKQGTVYIIDLKKTDYKHFVGCKGVVSYVDELENVKEAVAAFEEEYNKRIEIINKGYTDEKGIQRPYIDMNDYNSRNKNNQFKDFMLLIDEYADIADTFQDRNKRPIGVYADIIKLARKCRAVGGRIILGTQRPSVDVVIGTLKNNCELIGMGCLNATNSKIVLDVEGCEKLRPREALLYYKGKITKMFSYSLTDEQIIQLTDKLK